MGILARAHQVVGSSWISEAPPFEFRLFRATMEASRAFVAARNSHWPAFEEES